MAKNIIIKGKNRGTLDLEKTRLIIYLSMFIVVSILFAIAMLTLNTPAMDFLEMLITLVAGATLGRKQFLGK